MLRKMLIQLFSSWDSEQRLIGGSCWTTAF